MKGVDCIHLKMSINSALNIFLHLYFRGHHGKKIKCKIKHFYSTVAGKKTVDPNGVYVHLKQVSLNIENKLVVPNVFFLERKLRLVVIKIK